MEKDKIIQPCKLLVIGGSAGSLEVLLRVLPQIKETLSFTIVIVLHRKNSPDSALSDLFATRTKIPVKEIEDKQQILHSHIYVTPADYHLLFEKNNFFSLDFSEKINYSRPSIDVAFESAADIYKSQLTCLYLSGANSDGTNGLKVVKQNGGQIAVQNPETADSPFMPRYAILNTEVDFILDITEMAEFINSLN